MKCPFCSTLDSKVIDSRPANDGTSIRRRRECLQCHSRFTTYETVEMLPIVVIKKNGMRQSFDRSKLLSSMLKALDEVAYVRFASVYRQFKDINTFMEELNKLLDQKK